MYLVIFHNLVKRMVNGGVLYRKQIVVAKDAPLLEIWKCLSKFGNLMARKTS